MKVCPDCRLTNFRVLGKTYSCFNCKKVGVARELIDHEEISEDINEIRREDLLALQKNFTDLLVRSNLQHRASDVCFILVRAIYETSNERGIK